MLLLFIAFPGIYVNNTDLISRGGSTPPGKPGRAETTGDDLFGDEEMRQAMELLFFAYRDFTGEPDVVLADYGFGRAHHRVIYFVGRTPGLAVNELLAILKITKQSLARVLGQLVEENFIVQKTDSRDRRRRLLHLTKRGQALERQLREKQARRIARAYRAAGPDAVQGFKAILKGMINEEDRERFAAR